MACGGRIKQFNVNYLWAFSVISVFVMLLYVFNLIMLCVKLLYIIYKDSQQNRIFQSTALSGL